MSELKPVDNSLVLHAIGKGMHPAAYRLKGLIRTELPGRCKILCIGDQCECGLCDVERLQEALDHLADVNVLLLDVLRELYDAIDHYMKMKDKE